MVECIFLFMLPKAVSAYHMKITYDSSQNLNETATKPYLTTVNNQKGKCFIFSDAQFNELTIMNAYPKTWNNDLNVTSSNAKQIFWNNLKNKIFFLE